jgi:hypothetical protein
MSTTASDHIQSRTRLPLTPALSPEYRGEGAGRCVASLSRLRERVGVRVGASLNRVAHID